MALARFRVVATGGTFDEIHAGHVALLAKAFEVGGHVIIGVTSDEFVRGRKKINHTFAERAGSLRKMIAERFGSSVSYEIAKLDSDFGPAATTGDVGALVASAETASKGKVMNEIRKRNGLAPAEVIAVDLVKAQDGRPISSTRIRAGEIDGEGRLLKA